MRAEVSSLASRIDVNQREMKAILDAWLEKMDANREEKEAVEETTEALEDRGGNRPLAVGRWRNGHRAMVGPGRSWLLPKESWPTEKVLHRTRDTVIRDQARMLLYMEALKDGCLQRDIGRNLKASMA
jgi:hypothetical protein